MGRCDSMSFDQEKLEMQGRTRITLDMFEGCAAFSSTIPEVSSNLVYTKEKPHDRKEEHTVTRLDGRVDDLAIPLSDKVWPVFSRALKGY